MDKQELLFITKSVEGLFFLHLESEWLTYIPVMDPLGVNFETILKECGTMCYCKHTASYNKQEMLLIL